MGYKFTTGKNHLYPLLDKLKSPSSYIPIEGKDVLAECDTEVGKKTLVFLPPLFAGTLGLSVIFNDTWR